MFAGAGGLSSELAGGDAAPGQLAREGLREDGDPRGGVGEQGDIGREGEARGDDARKRFLRQPTLRRSRLRASSRTRPAVALRAHRARADEHGVDGGAQCVEELSVRAVADRPGAPPHGGPPIGGARHVQEDPRTPRRLTAAIVPLSSSRSTCAPPSAGSHNRIRSTACAASGSARLSPSSGVTLAGSHWTCGCNRRVRTRQITIGLPGGFGLGSHWAHLTRARREHGRNDLSTKSAPYLLPSLPLGQQNAGVKQCKLSQVEALRSILRAAARTNRGGRVTCLPAQ